MERTAPFNYALHTCGYCVRKRMCWIKEAGEVSGKDGRSLRFYTAVCSECLQACIDGFPGKETEEKMLTRKQMILLPASSLCDDCSCSPCQCYKTGDNDHDD